MQQIYTMGKFKIRWLPMPFGLYEGLTLPEIFFINPGYIFWLVENQIIRKDWKYSRVLAKQAELIYSRAKAILPAHAPRDEYEFLLLKDKLGVFARAITVTKGSPLPSKFKGKLFLAKRCPTLDAFAFKNYKKPEAGFENMASSLRRTLFPYLEPKPATADFELFMITPGNFAAK